MHNKIVMEVVCPCQLSVPICDWHIEHITNTLQSNSIPFLGILAITKPCSIVVDVKELFNSESKSQVYAHLHKLLQKQSMEKIDTINNSPVLF